ncbi:MAG: tetratricopeptide repeat protein [Candidatus Helarchaeota archaeon]|nr:tetratricopeptide repeat protein [Candidatus Helarchaeota archaeon]
MAEDIQAQISKLMQGAEKAEGDNNWNAAIALLKQAEEILLNKNLKQDEGNVFYRLARNHHLAGDSAKTKEEVSENYKLAIAFYKKALNIFEELKIAEKKFAISGFIDLLTYIFGFDVGNETSLLESAKNHFKDAKIMYQQNGNLHDSFKMEIMETRTLTLLIGELTARFDQDVDYKKIIAEFDALVLDMIEQLAKKPKLSDYYLHRFLTCMGYCFHYIGTYVPNDIINIEQQLTDILNRNQKIINIIDSTRSYDTYFESKFYVCLIHSSFNLILGAYYAKTQFEIKKLYKSARNWHKQAEELLPKNQFNTSNSTFYILKFSISISMIILGYSSSDFKHVVQILINAINSMTLFCPKPMAAHMIVASCIAFSVGALDESSIKIQRMELAKRILEIIDFGEKEIPMFADPNYKQYNFMKSLKLCVANAVLGDLVEDKDEQSKYLQKATELFKKVTDIAQEGTINNQAFFMYFYYFSLIGVILAKNSKEINEQRKYYEMTINLLEHTLAMPFDFHRYDSLFLLGKTYYDLGKLLTDEGILKKSYLAYTKAIEFCKKRGFYFLVGSGYVQLAQLEDRLGNFLSAAENYQNAISSFDQALLVFTFTNLGKKIEKTKKYLSAWKLIEIAKSYHAQEDHANARLNYDQASAILQKIREYRFESTFYNAWSELENAEELSKASNHQKAAKAYDSSKTLFQEAVDNFNKYLKKRLPPSDEERISNLIKVARIRDQYCMARQHIETARVESIRGNHILSAELYNKAGFMFENMCEVYKIKREKKELSAIYFLCKAWEHMAKAENEQKPSLYATASNLFEKASGIFTKSRMKKLSLGNSLYCSALESGSLFDKTSDLDEKIKYYKKIKMNLRESAKNYQLGGFVPDAQWALATSTVFDGIWQLIQVDTEVDFTKKSQYLSMAKKYLDTALKIFEEAGYEQKKHEITKYLEMIDTEKAILTSALDVIEKPAISESSIGIVAPSCPIEISSSLSIGEMQKTDMEAESEQNWFKRIHHLYLFVPGGVCIYDHPFESEAMDDESVSASLVSAGLEGISMMIQEVTKKETKVKIVEQEDMTILLEHGKEVTAALITEENLETLKTKMKQLINELEEAFQTELETFDGDITVFSKAEKFVQKIFVESPVTA